jgi:hypothetical protein
MSSKYFEKEILSFGMQMTISHPVSDVLFNESPHVFLET